MYLGATYPGSVGGAVVPPAEGQSFVSLVLGVTGVGSSKKKGTGATTPLALAIVGVGKSVRKGIGLVALQLSATGVGEKIEEASAEGFAPLFLVAEGLGAGEGEYYGEARPDETLTPGDWIPLNIASLEQAVNDSNDGTYAQSQVVSGTTRTIELLEGTTVRATRTIESGGGAWVEEAFLLSGVEKASIASWADIRVRVTDGGTPVVYGFPALITPPSNVEIYVRTRLEALVNGYSLKTSLVAFWELEETTGLRLDSHGTNHLTPSLMGGLQAFWELEEASGTRNDSHGASHLTDNNGVTQAAGKINQAAHFTAASSPHEYLSVADNAALSTGDINFTISAWIRLDSFPGASAQTVVSKWTTAGNREYLLYISSSTSTLWFQTTSGFVEATGIGALSLNTWYHIVAWHDAANDVVGVAVNGGTANTGAATTSPNPDGSAPFSIGGRSDVSLGTFFDGRIDQVGFWKRVLTSAERTALYNSGNGLSYAAMATAVGTVGSAAGKVGTAADFEASSFEHLSAPDNANLSMGDIDFTFAAWVKPETLLSMNILGKSGAGGTNGEYVLAYSNSPASNFRFGVFGAASNGAFDIVYASTFGAATAGVWYFIVVWHDATADTINIQINNGAINSVAHSGGVYDGAGNFNVGAHWAQTFWDGLIDQVGIWKRVLSAHERTWLYNLGAGREYLALGPPVQGTDLLVDLEALWEMNEPSGTRYDAHGSNHLTDNNTVTQAVGKAGKAAQFTAANSETLSIADNATISGGNTSFTIAGWVYLDSKPSYMGILQKVGEFDLNYVGGATDRFQCAFYEPPGFPSLTISHTLHPSTGTWYFLMIWHDADTNEIGLQVNITSVTASYANGVGDFTNPLTFGEYSGASYFNGRMDQFGFWRRRLTQAEWLWLFNDGNGRAYAEISGITTLTDLVVFWAFEDSGNLGKDSHGAIDMTNVDAVTAVAGLVGNALDVEYSSVGHLSVADPPFTYIGDGDWTIMAWVKLESSASLYSIISKGDSSDPEWHLQFNNTGSKFRLQAYAAAAGASGTTLTSTVTTGTGLWHLILAWHDADAGTINLQINDNAPESTAHAGGAYNGDGPITIGTDAAGNRFDGLIDQVAIWARKLSPDERTWLYNAGAGRAYSELGAILS